MIEDTNVMDQFWKSEPLTHPIASNGITGTEESTKRVLQYCVKHIQIGVCNLRISKNKGILINASMSWIRGTR